MASACSLAKRSWRSPLDAPHLDCAERPRLRERTCPADSSHRDRDASGLPRGDILSILRLIDPRNSSIVLLSEVHLSRIPSRGRSVRAVAVAPGQNSPLRARPGAAGGSPGGGAFSGTEFRAVTERGIPRKDIENYRLGRRFMIRTEQPLLAVASGQTTTSGCRRSMPQLSKRSRDGGVLTSTLEAISTACDGFTGETRATI